MKTLALALLTAFGLTLYSQQNDSIVVFNIHGNSESFLIGHISDQSGNALYYFDYAIIDSLIRELEIQKNAIKDLKFEVTDLKTNLSQKPDTLFIRGKGIEVIKEE